MKKHIAVVLLVALMLPGVACLAMGGAGAQEIGDCITPKSSKVNIREKPTLKSDVVGKLKMGEKQKIVDNVVPKWYGVNLGRGLPDWIADWVVNVVPCDDAPTQQPASSQPEQDWEGKHEK